MTSLEKLEDWIRSQYVYNASDDMDLIATKNNFLNICRNQGTVDIKALASETGITRSVFYHNDKVKDRVDELKVKLNKKFPSDFAGSVKKKKNNGSVSRNKGTDDGLTKEYDQSSSKTLLLTRHNAELEKQLHEERAKNAKLEKDIERLRKDEERYGPSVKALFELEAFPMPNKSESGST